MSESHYWPGPDQPGTYTLEHHSGAVWKDAVWNGERWENKWSSFDPLEVLSWGYLGVRREQAKIDEHAEDVAQLKADFDNAKEDAWDWMLVANERAVEIEKLRAEVKRLEAAVNTWVEIAINRRDESKSLSRMIDERDAILREAIAEFRANVKQPTKAADWAFRWASRFIEAEKQ